MIPGFSDKFTSIFAPFAVYWILSFFFHLVDVSGYFEDYRIHEPEEEKKKNRVTVKQVIWAVLFQQAIQTALALVWLEDDDVSVGPFRDHQSDIRGYSGVIDSIVMSVLGNKVGRSVVQRYGDELASFTYWWAVPIFQFFFASSVSPKFQFRRILIVVPPDSCWTPGNTFSTAIFTPTSSSTAISTRGITDSTSRTHSAPSTITRSKDSSSTR